MGNLFKDFSISLLIYDEKVGREIRGSFCFACMIAKVFSRHLKSSVFIQLVVSEKHERKHMRKNNEIFKIT